jgi:hypothetical protein
MTQQVPDQLRYQGRTRALRTSPLQPYLETRPDLKARLEAPDSSLWRGYRASWEIRGDRLYLTALTVWMRHQDGTVQEHGVEAVFQRGAEAVFASWFTGALDFDDGESPVRVRIDAGNVAPA